MLEVEVAASGTAGAHPGHGGIGIPRLPAVPSFRTSGFSAAEGGPRPILKG